MRLYAKIMLAVFLLGLIPLMSGAVPIDRSGVLGKFALELDGVVVGFIQSADGGNPIGDVATSTLGPDHVARKHIAGVKYEEITITLGTGMGSKLYDWIKATMDGNPQRKNGAIIAADFNNRVVSRTTFSNALITEIGFPALDASNKDAAKMTIKFQPEYTRRTVGDGSQLRLVGNGKIQKKWLPANFRLRIDGLDSATSRVNKIEAITVKQKVTENAVGENRDYVLEPAGLEISSLVFTTTESHAQPLMDWRDDFLIRGNNGEDQEKTGTLEYLTPDLKDVFFRITFHNLGIFHLAPVKMETNSEKIQRVKAEMYCEDVRLDYTDAATAGSPQVPS